MLTPNGVIEIFKGIKLNKDAEDTLDFVSVAAQNAYFEGLTTNRLFRETESQEIVWNFETNRVRVKSPYDTLKSANYMRFKNPTAYGDKWVYAFATPILKSNGQSVTELVYEIDPLQTWLKGVDYNLTECHVLREHQGNNDQIAGNTAPERIQISAYHPNIIKVLNNTPVYEEKIDVFEHGYYIALMLPRTHQGSKLFYGYNDGTYSNPDYKPLNGDGDIPLMQMVDNVPCENVIVLLDMTDDNVPQIGDPEYDQDYPNMKRCWLRFIKINRYWGDYIINTWVIPKDFINSNHVDDKVCLSTGLQFGSAVYVVCPNVLFNYTITYTQGTNYTAVYDGNINAKDNYKALTASLSTLYTDYVVKNKKVFVNPTCFYEIIAPNGQTEIMAFEDMRADLQDPISGNPLLPNVAHKPYFKVLGSILETKISIIPFGYNYQKFSFDRQSGLPTPPVGASKGVIDTTVPSSILSSIIELGSTAVGSAVGGPAGAAIGQIATGGAMAITQNTMPQGSTNIYNLSNITMWAESIRYFTGIYMVAENYKEIDNYYEAYGYTQNRYGIPRFPRTLWNYVQTDGANFQSVNVPAEAMREINSKYDKGIRFHKEDKTIGNLAPWTNGFNP